MRFDRMFADLRKPGEGSESASSINQGMYYLYMIVGLQIVLVFGIMAIVMGVGSVISTPGWIFLAVMLVATAGMVYLYRKARKKFRQLKESLGKMDLSGCNYEVSLLGGMLTMRVEQNNSQTRLLEAPPASSGPAVLEAEVLDPPAPH
ncbi:MAG: hypothetical protein ACLGPL_10725 [Acidobacteriota bacterium]